MDSSSPAKSQLRPFGARDRWAYAMGDFGCNLSFALNSYLMLFYTQYIGLSLTTWGVIILLLKIWDGINDPIMGGLMDSLKPGKRGKFKSYIFLKPGSLFIICSFLHVLFYTILNLICRLSFKNL